MDNDYFVYKLVECDHWEAANVYAGLVKNRLSELEGFRVSIEEKDKKFHVLFKGKKEVFKTMENFLGGIAVRLFFF